MCDSRRRFDRNAFAPGGGDVTSRDRTMLASLRQINPSQYVIYVGFLLIFVVFSIVLRDDGFLTTFNLFNIVQQSAPVTVMAVGAVFVGFVANITSAGGLVA